MIELSNIKKSFTLGKNNIEILKGLNLKINNPGVYAIMGKSGSGKSTLLSLLGGLDWADEGVINIGGSNLQKLSETERTEFRAANIGIVFQDFHLLPYLTAKENMALPLQIQNDSKVDDKIEKMARLLNIESRLNSFPPLMSGGERQRVAIGRAFIANPQLILADEPTGNLDQETGESISNKLIEVAKELKQTLLIVTHDKDLALKCDQVFELKDGAISTYVAS